MNIRSEMPRLSDRGTLKFPLVYCPSLGFEITALSVCTSFQPIFYKTW